MSLPPTTARWKRCVPRAFRRGNAFMKPLVMLILLSLLCFASPRSQQPTYGALKAEAERLYAEASYSKAREIYLKARAVKLQPEESRWVEFRLADTLWRAPAASQTPGTTKTRTAQAQRGRRTPQRAAAGDSRR